MSALVPTRFLFDLELTLAYRAKAPRVTGTLGGWSEEERLPNFGALEGASAFADVRMCWGDWGVAIVCDVGGKREPVKCDPKAYWTADNVRLCIDTRDARANRRASRYCQQFFVLPTGKGKDDEPVLGTGQFQRAREHAPPVPIAHARVASKLRDDGYCVEAVLPAECLSGFAPEQHSRIGLYYLVEDAEHGQQYLTVGDDLYWNIDPSTWASAVLAR